jgi:hypothetical protein
MIYAQAQCDRCKDCSDVGVIQLNRGDCLETAINVMERAVLSQSEARWKIKDGKLLCYDCWSDDEDEDEDEDDDHEVWPSDVE